MAKYYGVRPEFQLEVVAAFFGAAGNKGDLHSQRAFGFTLCEALAAARRDELTQEAERLYFSMRRSARQAFATGAVTIALGCGIGFLDSSEQAMAAHLLRASSLQTHLSSLAGMLCGILTAGSCIRALEQRKRYCDKIAEYVEPRYEQENAHAVKTLTRSDLYPPQSKS